MVEEENQPYHSESSDIDDILDGIAAAGVLIGGLFAAKKLLGWLLGTDEDESETHFRQGCEYDEAGDVKNAIREYYECIRCNMDHAYAHNLIAWMLSTRRLQPDRAIFHANQALRVEPHNASFYDTLAEALIAKGDLGSAFQACQKGLDLVHPAAASTQFLLHLRVARIYQHNDQFRESIPEFKTAEEINQPSPPYDLADVHYGLAYSYKKLGDYENALSYTQKALSQRDCPDFRELEAALCKVAPHVFICYAHQDAPVAIELANRLADAGMDPWLDKRKLLLADNYEREINKAVKRCDAFIVCLRPGAFNQIGYRQKEIRWAIEALDRRPPGNSFIIPFVVEPCTSDDLPSWVEELSIHVTLGKRTEFAELLSAIKKIVNVSGVWIE